MTDVSAARKWRRWMVIALALNAVVVAGLGNLAVWWPLRSHFYVSPAPTMAAVLNQHRGQPTDEVLTVVADASMMTDHPLQGEAAVAAARRLLRGELALPSLPVLEIDITFDSRDLHLGVPVQQLFMCSLIVPDLLLRAYAHTPDPAFIAAARAYLRRFIAYEARSQIPDGYVRNSHAVANRAAVLARFWKYVRHAEDSDDRTAREVHLHASRLMALLSKPQLFIGATNHGVMQNIALLQLTTAFPALEGTDVARRLALERLALQLPMWMGADGAILEHSAGYHFHGVVLTGYIVRVLEAAGQPVPEQWRSAHEATSRFLATLQRPDGTLPALGNTFRYAWRLPVLVDSGVVDRVREAELQSSFTRTFPISGHAVWWDAITPAGVSTQTVVPWGYFVNHGHRRAQELSLLIWSAGTDWSTNSGYWPGDDPTGVELASGWGGGNAPHVIGEAADAVRRTTVNSQAQEGPLRFLDLERFAPGGSSVRRQVIQWRGQSWMVLDTHVDPANRPLRVLWTSAPETEQTQIAERSFRVEREGSPVALSLQVLGSSAVTARALRGSRDPFGGWVAVDRKAVPAPSVDVRLQQPGGFMLTRLTLASHHESRSSEAAVTRFAGPEDWEMRFTDGDASVAMVRRGMALSIHEVGRGSPPRSIALSPGEDVGGALESIERADEAVALAYPRVRTFEYERRRYSMALLVLWLVLSVAIVLAYLGVRSSKAFGTVRS